MPKLIKSLRLLTVALCALSFSACYHYRECHCDPTDTVPTTLPSDTPVVIEPTIDSATVSRHLQSHIDRTLPMTGLVLWVDKARELDATYRNSIALEFTYCLPCKVVTGKTSGAINYDWSTFDSMLDDIASRNHQAVVRFRYEYPSSTDVDGKKGTTAVPDYIKQLPDYHETYSSNPGGDGPTYYADWSNEELLWFTKQFYTDFCARYANDRRLAFLEVGFGHWSEYHIYGTDLSLGHNFPTKEYQKEFFIHLSQVANQLPWCISIDAADSYYTPFLADNTLMSLQFGLFDDSFMHEGHEIGSSDGYNERNWNAIGTDRWKHSPCGGEISYYTSRDQRDFLNPQGLYGTTWEQASTKYHITFMIANDAPDGQYGTSERFLQASNAVGYRFEIIELLSDNEKTQLTIANTGIAPIYRPAYVSVNGQKNDFDLTQLLPRSAQTITFEASKTDSLQIEILSDYTLTNIPFEANL